jgi:hypothetical protein
MRLVLLAHLLLSVLAEYRFPTVNPNTDPDGDPVNNEERLHLLHAIIKDWPSETAFDYDSNFPEEVQPIKITAKMYNEIFFGPKPPETKWYIAVVYTERPEDHIYYSEWIVNTMKILADELQGKVRFGWVHFHEEEMIREMLDCYNAPNLFLFHDGMVYE